MSIDLSAPAKKPSAGFGSGAAVQGHATEFAVPAQRSTAGFNQRSIDLSAHSQNPVRSVGSDQPAPHHPTLQQAPTLSSSSYASEERADSQSTAPAGALTLLCTQAECCFRLLALAWEEAKILLAALGDLGQGGAIVQRACAAADLLLLVVACLGVWALGELATAHIVNCLVMGLSALGLLVEAAPPHFAAARETVLCQLHFLREPRGLAALHGAQGALALALWHDGGGASYGLAAVASAAAACLGIAGDRLGWAAGAAGGGWGAMGAQEAAVVGVPL